MSSSVLACSILFSFSGGRVKNARHSEQAFSPCTLTDTGTDEAMAALLVGEGVQEQSATWRLNNNFCFVCFAMLVSCPTLAPAGEIGRGQTVAALSPRGEGEAVMCLAFIRSTVSSMCQLSNLTVCWTHDSEALEELHTALSSRRLANWHDDSPAGGDLVETPSPSVAIALTSFSARHTNA